jgi:hypothetical protein
MNGLSIILSNLNLSLVHLYTWHDSESQRDELFFKESNGSGITL